MYHGLAVATCREALLTLRDRAVSAAGFAARLEQWKKDCAEKGSIPAEKPAFDDADWEPVERPSLLPPDFDGCAWFRRTVRLTGEQAAGGSVLSLGALDDRDIDYVNGVQVGSDVGDSPRDDHEVRALVKDWRSHFTHPDCNLVNGENLPCGPFELGIR